MLVNGASHKKYDSILINVDYPFPSDFPGGHANLRSFNLPEGDYYLVPKPVNWILRTRRAPIYRFRVIGGAVSYVGSLYFSGASINLVDGNSSRDIDLFLRRNPELKRSSVGEDLMRFDSEYSIDDPNRFEVKGVIFGSP
ncbi:hypothetical protein [Burkholderia cepacia]|uniref:hypothetical protein n=1 Tax=Burkholderia cepacia TaxID=292 RepID=UPI003D6755A7